MTNGTYEAGDVVAVYVPFVDAGGGKVRPAAVVSAGTYNRRTDLVIVAPITKAQAPRGLYVNVELAQGALTYKSRIKTDVLVTVEQKLVQRRIGRLTNQVRDAVARRVIPNLHIPT